MLDEQLKKVILFIVEGNSDRIALENIVRKIMQKYDRIKFRITRGDITSNKDITVSNVNDEIYYYVEKEVQESYLSFDDIEEIVHIVDTDGSFINDKYVQHNDSYRLMYYIDHIETRKIEDVIERNHKKAEILEYLSKQDKIKKVPYGCYYMSANLDHVLYNEINVRIEEKEEMATKFAISYEGKEEKFIDFLNEVGVEMNYYKSWEFIKNKTESLKRHSNFNLYFKKYFS